MVNFYLVQTAVGLSSFYFNLRTDVRDVNICVRQLELTLFQRMILETVRLSINLDLR